jgi:branched-subunit amino acid transport protein
MITEAPWALSRHRESGRRVFYLGAAITLFVGWPTLVTTGTLTGSWLSTAPVTALLPALTLGAVVVRQLRGRSPGRGGGGRRGRRPGRGACVVSVLLAVLVVGAGSLLFRLVPLLGARLLPPGLPRLAGRVGVAVLTAIIVRTVLLHQDAGVAHAPLVAGLSVGLGLALAFRGRPVLASVAVGVASYLVLGAIVAALS